MATKRANVEERLDDAHIERVIALLEPKDGSKGCTKKEACAILNIAYNTTRLGTIIDKYKETKAKEADRRAKLRGKAATPDEVQFIIQEYLEGQPIDSISKSTYRSAGLIKQILEKYNVPLRAKSYSYFTPELIPDGAMRDRFKVGEVVYSARYDSTARIEAEFKTKDQEWGYRLWLMSEKWLQSCNQPASELASLDHLRELGVRV